MASPHPMSSVQQEVDNAMGIMRNNMVNMAERESSLQNLQGKSDLLQGTSGQFSRQAKRLRWEMRWQQYRLVFLLMAMVAWTALFFLFQHHKPIFLACSLGVALLAYLVQRVLAKRARAQLESDDTRQLLSTGEP